MPHQRKEQNLAAKPFANSHNAMQPLQCNPTKKTLKSESTASTPNHSRILVRLNSTLSSQMNVSPAIGQQFKTRAPCCFCLPRYPVRPLQRAEVRTAAAAPTGNERIVVGCSDSLTCGIKLGSRRQVSCILSGILLPHNKPRDNKRGSRWENLIKTQTVIHSL